MNAVILAGGKGSRLYPLTENLPKPLLNLCGKPVLCYILDLLKTHGCKNAAITLLYHGKKIEQWFDSEDYKGIHLSFCYENTPLGTAGCVKRAAEKFADDYIVISGDAMCNVNLTAAMQLHKARKADVTIITVSRDNPGEYGIVTSDDSGTDTGKITGFIEKPSLIGCTENRVNTGIYILSPKVTRLIPEGFCDFAGDLFPKLLQTGNIYADNQECYWCDIGDLRSYRICQRDMTEGKTGAALSAPEVINAGRSDSKFSPAALQILCPPYYIGSNVTAGRNVKICGGAVIGDNVTIGDDCIIDGAIVGEGVFIGDNVKLSDCIVVSGASVKSDSAVYTDAVAAAGSIVGSGCIIKPGVKLGSGVHTGDNLIISSDIEKGGGIGFDITDSGYKGVTNITVTPQLMARLGAALSKAAEGGMISVGCKSGDCSYTLMLALLSGISAAGGNAIDCKALPLSVLIHKSRLTGCSLCCYISGGKNTEVTILSGNGLPITRRCERSIEQVLNRGGEPRADYRSFGRIIQSRDSGILYTAMLCKCADFRCDYNIKLDSHNRLIKEYADPVFEQISRPDKQSMIISVSADGTRCEIYTAETDTVSHEQLLYIAFRHLLDKGEKIACPYDLPIEFSDNDLQNTLYYHACPADNCDIDARRVAATQPFLTDGCVLALYVLGCAAAKNISFGELVNSLPRYSFYKEYLPLKNHNSLSAIKKLAQNGAKYAAEGVELNKENDKVNIRCARSGKGLYLYSRAVSQETARELCSFAESRIKEALE